MKIKSFSRQTTENLLSPLHPSGSDAFTCNARGPGLIPGLGRPPGVHAKSLQSCPTLCDPMDRGAWQATVHAVAKNRTWLSDFHFTKYLVGNLIKVRLNSMKK